MRASRRGARDLLVAASRSNARSASYGRFWSTAVRLASASAARGCASWTSPARRCRHRALGARGFAADAADARPPTECWACGAPFGASAEHRFFCDACGEILPARVAAPARGSDGAAPVLFRVLGIAPRFEVDLDALEAAMKRLQKVLHPDKFGARSARARAHSAEQASLVNRAYAVLRDPLRRAKYMLAARGERVGDDDDDDFADDAREQAENEDENRNARTVGSRDPNADGDSEAGGARGHSGAPYVTRSDIPEREPVDPEVLMLAMETREAIEDATADPEPTRRREALAAVAAAVAARESACAAALARAFDGDPPDVRAAKRATIELAYLARAREEIQEKR